MGIDRFVVIFLFGALTGAAIIANVIYFLTIRALDRKEKKDKKN